MQYGYPSDYQPVFYYDYTIGGTSTHHHGTVRSILDFMGEDSYASSGEGLAFFFEELFDIDRGQDRRGQLTLEKRVFLVPVAPPSNVFSGRKAGFLDVDEKFASAAQTSHWVKTNKDFKYHNVATSGADLSTLGDYERWITFQRGGWSMFEDFYENKYRGNKDKFKTYRTMLKFRAKYDIDEVPSTFEADSALESFTSRDGAYATESDIYEVFYTAVCSPLLYSGQVLSDVFHNDTKVFASCAEVWGDPEFVIPSHPQIVELTPGGSGGESWIEGFEKFSGTDIESVDYIDGIWAEVADVRFATGEGVRTGEGATFLQEYAYNDADLRTAIQVRYQIQSGHQYAVQEVFENFFGALTTQLVDMVGWDTIPRAYTTKMQESRPIKPELLSSMESEGMTTLAPTRAPVATTTATTAGGSY